MHSLLTVVIVIYLLHEKTPVSVGRRGILAARAVQKEALAGLTQRERTFSGARRSDANCLVKGKAREVGVSNAPSYPRFRDAPGVLHAPDADDARASGGAHAPRILRVSV